MVDYLYINLACLSFCLFVCLSVCLYPINVKILFNICLHQNSIFIKAPSKARKKGAKRIEFLVFIKFLKILKIHEIFCENPRIIFVLFYDVHKENMFTINLKDGREAPYKASNR